MREKIEVIDNKSIYTEMFNNKVLNVQEYTRACYLLIRDIVRDVLVKLFEQNYIDNKSFNSFQWKEELDYIVSFMYYSVSYGFFEIYIPKNQIVAVTGITEEELTNAVNNHFNKLKTDKIYGLLHQYFWIEITDTKYRKYIYTTDNINYQKFIKPNELIIEEISLLEENYERTLIAETKIIFEMWILEDSNRMLSAVKLRSKDYYWFPGGL